MKFNEYLCQKRKDCGYTLRQFASLIGISPAFLCDLEKGVRNIPTKSVKYPNLKELIIENLCMNDEEKEIFNSLLDESLFAKNKVSADISSYLKEQPCAMQALRMADEKKISEEIWEKILEIISKEV